MTPHRLMRLVPAILAVALVAAAPAGRIDSLLARSRAAEAHGRTTEAIGLMQAVVVADPARAASYVALGDLYARQHAPHFARKYYAEALDLDPSLAPALLGAARTDLALGDRAAAKKKLARLMVSCAAECREVADLRAALASPEDGRADTAAASLDKN